MEESNFLEGSITIYHPKISLYSEWTTEDSLSPQQGMLDGKQPERCVISSYLSPARVGGLGGSERLCQLLSWVGSPCWPTGDPAEGLNEHFPFPRNQISQRFDGWPEGIPVYAAASGPLFLSGSEEGGLTALRGCQGPSHSSWALPRSSLH